MTRDILIQESKVSGNHTLPTREDYKAAIEIMSNHEPFSGSWCNAVYHCWPTIQSALSAMADDGWQLVPKEVTNGMIKMNGMSGFSVNRDWKAMLAAAPTYGSEE